MATPKTRAAAPAVPPPEAASSDPLFNLSLEKGLAVLRAFPLRGTPPVAGASPATATAGMACSAAS